MIEIDLRNGNGRERLRSKGSKIEENLFWSRAASLASLFAEQDVKRLSFVLGALAIAAFALVTKARRPSFGVPIARRQTWAEHIESIARRTNTRRHEHWIQSRMCVGEYDRHKSPAQVAARKHQCAKICGLCRYIHSLDVWPDPKYRRPSRAVLDALENQPCCPHEREGSVLEA